MLSLNRTVKVIAIIEQAEPINTIRLWVITEIILSFFEVFSLKYFELIKSCFLLGGIRLMLNLSPLLKIIFNIINF